MDCDLKREIFGIVLADKFKDFACFCSGCASTLPFSLALPAAVTEGVRATGLFQEDKVNSRWQWLI